MTEQLRDALHDGTDVPEVEPLIRVRGLNVEFRTAHATVRAVNDVNFDVPRGQTLSIVGESGSGKSTTARALLRLEPAARGEIRYQGTDIASLSASELRRLRPDMQMIFQDPIASLNPRQKIEDIVAEGLRIWPGRGTSDINAQVDALLRQVGMNPDVVRGRRASEFSGGQCQRIAIARALAVKPTFLMCDEPVSALDVSVQAQVLNLLRALKSSYGLTIVFISHDLSVVRNISDQVLVMYLGTVCEIAPADDFFSRPRHPYSQLLLASAPGSTGGTRVETVAGEQPSSLNSPSGCPFRTRCPWATAVCAEEVPELREIGPGQRVACHHADDLAATRNSGASASHPS